MRLFYPLSPPVLRFTKNKKKCHTDDLRSHLELKLRTSCREERAQINCANLWSNILYTRHFILVPVWRVQRKQLIWTPSKETCHSEAHIICMTILSGLWDRKNVTYCHVLLIKRLKQRFLWERHVLYVICNCNKFLRKNKRNLTTIYHSPRQKFPSETRQWSPSLYFVLSFYCD